MGTVVISVDAELGWGFHDYEPEDRPTERIERSRWGWNRLADLFEEFRVPATWAIVGHLFESECNGAHVGHPSPPGWFDHERDPDPMPAEFRFAPDLVRDLVDGPVDHDIGSHTYSHVEFGEAYATPDLARAECERSMEVAEAAGLSLSSFIFPRNKVGHRAALAEAGFTCYRGPAPEPAIDGPLLAPARKLARATVVDAAPPLVEPTVDEHGLVNVPASLFLYELEGPARRAIASAVGDPVLKQARLGIDAAATGDGICHLWLHPNNVRQEHDVEPLREILRYLDRTRERTDLTVETMADVAEATLRGERQRAKQV
ncbi:polysaccharide deacetylase family protein [Haloarcula nitratireducens]|uniref:Polysaccharide deacetylase family protein n=1 Tax=Haloarcula nitratireducens TaxID=2487749 RepID=A0AAW4P8E8_9EURY|nr:polysaccharide deacetylase family protein [Halomicroarcula nitratireducens]MBX0294053.1 polysaccharide deacetylase family protein [Halomicroarcula nitratireducens]